MVEELEELARFYRYLLVEYGGYYRAPKEKDFIFWRNLSAYCVKNELNPYLLMLSHFEFHKTRYNSTPYPNMLYGSDSLNRYRIYVADLLQRYPSGNLPIALLSKTLTIVKEVEEDCYRIRMIARELNLSRLDAAISIFGSLSPYTKLMEPKLTAWLKYFKDEKLKELHPYQQELIKNQGLKSLLNEILEKELYGRKIHFRSSIPEQDLSPLIKRS